MTGSGPAGELTFSDLRTRLAAVTQRIVDAQAAADELAADIAAKRGPTETENGNAGEPS